MISPTTFLPPSCWCVFLSAFWVGSGGLLAADIQGTITSNGSAVGQAVAIELWKQNPDTLIYDIHANTNSDPITGSYSFAGLNDGSYHVRALDFMGLYAAEFFGGAYRQADATPVEITAGITQTNPVDINIERGATISGSVVDQNGSPLSGILVGIEEVSDLQTMQHIGAGAGVTTDTSGEFRIGLRPGIYTVAFWSTSTQQSWATQIFSNRIAHELATPLVLNSVGDTIFNVDAVMKPGYKISGQVTDINGSPLSGVFASFEVYDSQAMEWGTTVSQRTSADGIFSVTFQPGEYKVKFEDDSLLYEQEYWNNGSSIILANTTVSGINKQLGYTPLAIWGLSFGINPFSNVQGWLYDDPDQDGYNNFHEFAFGTNPTDSSSGCPYQFSTGTNSTIIISTLGRTDVSTAYWLEYELQQSVNLGSGVWIPSTIVPSPILGPAPTGYTRFGISVPTAPDPCKFFRTQLSIQTH